MSSQEMSAGHEGRQSPELVNLFTTYTASLTSIGADFTRLAARVSADDPLIVATATDLALYPGGGAPPSVEGFRLSTQGFKELAGISHLGPALATLVRMKELDPDGDWRAGAERLLAATQTARLSNSEALWRDTIAVKTYAGRERAIAAMTDYACDITERYLQNALKDPRYATPESLRGDYLEGSHMSLPVPFNRVMIATFFLTGMDIAHRLISWFDSVDLPWERAMVIIAGKQGRPTAGVTWEVNSIAGIVLAASRGRLPLRHLLIAPHAPVFPPFDGTNADGVEALEQQYRKLWSGVLATTDLGESMFSGHPAFSPYTPDDTPLEPGTTTVSGMPVIASPADWFAMTTRLRVVLEDPRQLLSGAVTDYASKQLIEHGNDPSAVTVPGLDGEPYLPGLP